MICTTTYQPVAEAVLLEVEHLLGVFVARPLISFPVDALAHLTLLGDVVTVTRKWLLHKSPPQAKRTWCAHPYPSASHFLGRRRRVPGRERDQRGSWGACSSSRLSVSELGADAGLRPEASEAKFARVCEAADARKLRDQFASPLREPARVFTRV
jgi:hypothetical protein